MGANPEIPDDSTCSLLHHAALKDVIRLLLSYGVNVDVTNELGSSLLYAAAHGYHETIKVHGANAGADPNGGPDGNFLTIAAEVGIIQIIKLLVEACADPNVTDIVSKFSG
ncbi:uncharacterized protein LOC113306546 [Papaver somniferum]|uniref:uncharacterized protein LOC113306546 n=1 Tax=Papaver somniferum TaxID=3469 RepID=UPI000E7058EF|nr:uncharacterized protein LOC113306546 [Papaver somniferum]